VLAGQRGGRAHQAQRLGQKLGHALVPQRGVHAIAHGQKQPAPGLDESFERRGQGLRGPCHVQQRDDGVGAESVGGDVVASLVVTSAPGNAVAQGRLEEEGFVLVADGARVAVDAQDAQGARHLHVHLPAVVERKGILVDLDHQVVRGAAIAGQAVQEALARVTAGGKLDRPWATANAIHPQGHPQRGHAAGGEVRDLGGHGDAARAHPRPRAPRAPRRWPGFPGPRPPRRRR
jgi:hypothetical protein